MKKVAEGLSRAMTDLCTKVTDLERRCPITRFSATVSTFSDPQSGEGVAEIRATCTTITHLHADSFRSDVDRDIHKACQARGPRGIDEKTPWIKIV